MRSPALAGNVAALVSAAIFGASVVAVRSLGDDIPPLLLADLRFGQGGLLLFSLLLLVSGSQLRVERRDLPMLVLVGALMYGAFPVLFNLGLRFTEASRGALMIATGPLWSAVLGRVFGGERLTMRQIVGTMLSFVGVCIAFIERGVRLEGERSALVGDILMVLAAVAGAVAVLLMKRTLTRYHSLPVTAYMMLIGAAVLLPFALGEALIAGQRARFDERALLLLVFLGVVGGAVGYYLSTFGLSRLSPTQLMVYFNVNPMTATILGALLLDEHITLVFVAAFTLVLTGVVVVNWPRRTTAPRARDGPFPVQSG